MAEPGPKTMLTEELFGKIKICVLEGKNIRETASFCEIPENTFYDWTARNYLNISDKIEGWQRDRRLRLANITSDTIQTLPVLDENGKVDKELLKIKQKEAEFIRETLGKEIYSKRSELTGKDGGNLVIQTINYADTNSPQLPAERLPDTNIQGD